MEEIVIIGTGGHAKVVHDIILRQNLYKPVAFLSLDQGLESFLGLPHFHQSRIKQLGFNAGIVAVGDNFVRSRAVEIIRSQISSFKFITAIHPSAQIAHDVKIESGSVVMAQVAVNSGSRIGLYCILNTGVSVDHDCKLSDFSSLAPGCVLGGEVEVGEYSAISLGAKIIHGKKIGAHSVIGAGALVLADVSSYELAYGSPCNLIRKRSAGDKYL